MSEQTEMTPAATADRLVQMCKILDRPDFPAVIREPLNAVASQLLQLLETEIWPIERLATQLEALGPGSSKGVAVVETAGPAGRVARLILGRIALDSAGWPVWLSATARELDLDSDEPGDELVPTVPAPLEYQGRVTGAQAIAMARQRVDFARDATRGDDA